MNAYQSYRQTEDRRWSGAADDLAVRVLALHVIDHQILGDDHVPFHAEHLGDVGDAARTVAQARRLDDDVDRTDDDLANGLLRQGEAAHRDHGFHTAEALTRTVGVDRSHRAVMAGVHGLQQVEDLRSTHLADDDPFGTHTQTVLDEIAHGDLALALKVRRTGFKTHHMWLLELQFGGVFAGDDAFVPVDIPVRQFSSVVLPEPVPPEITTLQRDASDNLQQFAPSGVIEPKLTS
jgi:hypothetical protein